MKIFSFSTIIGLTITSFSLTTQAAEKTQCQLSVQNPKPPHVMIYPESGLTEGDHVQIEFNVPSLSANGTDQKRYLKIKDVDGSVSLMSLLYLSQNSEAPVPGIDSLISKALKKRLDYWMEDLRKQQNKPPIKPNSGVDPVLVENSIAVNRMLVKDGEKALTEAEKKMILKDVLGPMTDYDKNFKYEYREFSQGKYESKPPQRLADIFPPEFYASATSTSSLGLIKNKENAGKDNCEYLPVHGRLPKAGDVRSIRRPGQR